MDQGEELFHHDVRAWTVGDLRRALEGLPDHLPLRVNVAETPGGADADCRVVIGAGFGTVDWGGERGEEVEPVLSLDCEFPPGDYYRPRRP